MGSGQMGKPVFSVLDDDGCDRLHRAAVQVLADVGIEVRGERALKLLDRAGSHVSGTRAYIPKQVIDQALEMVPRHFLLPGRNDDGSLDLDVRPGAKYFGNGTDCLYMQDPRSGERRRAVLADVEMSAALCELLPNIDFVMSAVLPADVPLDELELAQFGAMVKNTRKPVIISPATGGETLVAMQEMAALAGRPESFACLAMSNPPLVLDRACLGKAIAAAELGIPFILGPGLQMGATGPASVAGSSVLSHAECLAAMVIHQHAAPGAPFLYGAGVAPLDMRTMVEAWAWPETHLGLAACCDVATWLGLPSWSYAGTSDAKSHDGQWASEAAATMMLAGLSNATLLHDVGEFESGVQNSLESVVFADTLIGYVRRLLSGVELTPEAMQVNDVAQVGPGGHFLARSYTRAHHREVWRSPFFDTSLHGHWLANGSPTLSDRLHDTTQALLESREPLLPDDVQSHIDRLSGGAVRRRQ